MRALGMHLLQTDVLAKEEGRRVGMVFEGVNGFSCY